jgi:hypothetical protein
MRIVELLNAIKADFSHHITGLNACALHAGPIDLSELAHIAGQAPAIYLSVLEIPNLAEPGTGERDVDLGLAAYIAATDGPGLPGIEAAVNLVEALLIHIPNNCWDLASGTFGARDVTSRNLHDGSIDMQGVALWAVTWKQTIRLGDSVWDEQGFLPTQVYLGQAPQIGDGHEADYEPIYGGDA